MSLRGMSCRVILFIVNLVFMTIVSDGRHYRWSMVVIMMVVVVARAHSADGYSFSSEMA